MVVTDPWVEFITQMFPEYNDLKRMTENGPRISAVLRTINLSPRVRIEENWDNTPADQHYRYYTADYNNLDSRCDWATKQLSSWRFVTRLSHQEWKFLRRKDAEKFITLYNLKWACQ